MKIARLYSGTDGKSHFEDIDIPLKTGSDGGLESQLFKATGVIFRETNTSVDLDWHHAPRRQYVLTLKGLGEIEVGDGTKRRFGPGDIMLAEDLTGQGHKTRVISKEARVSVFIAI